MCTAHPHRETTALWAAVQADVSDFRPFAVRAILKGLDHGHFEEAWGGIQSLQLGLPLVWTEQARGGSPKTWDIGSALHRLLGSDLNKGHLAVGMDADFCIWDPGPFQVAILRQTSVSPIWGSPSEESNGPSFAEKPF